MSVSAIAGTLYLFTLARGPTWAHRASDSGDFITAAAVQGVAHPTGYPLYLLLLSLFQQLPLYDLAWRSHLLSAACALGVAGVLYVLLRRVPSAVPHSWHIAVAALVALWAALAPLLWAHAIVTEVYVPSLLAVLLLLLWLQHELGGGGAARWQAPVAGAMLGLHVTLGLAVAVWALLPLRHRNGRAVAWRVAASAAGAVLVYALVPWWAVAEPPVNWGGASDAAGLWWLLSGAPYRALAFGLPANQFPDRVAALATLLLAQYGIAGLVAGSVGLVYGGGNQRGFIWLTVGLAVGWAAFAIGYNTADSSAYLLPVFLLWAYWMGAGALAGAAWLHAHQPRTLPIAAVVLAGIIGWQTVQTYPTADASRDTRAVDFATTVLQQAPPASIVLPQRDRDTFSLWYYHFAEQQRQDVRVVVEPLLAFAWYRRNLAAVYPDLRLPAEDGSAWSRATLRAANPTRPICYTDVDATPPLTCEGGGNPQ